MLLPARYKNQPKRFLVNCADFTEAVSSAVHFSMHVIEARANGWLSTENRLLAYF